jgi:hypothetical protein
MTTFTSISRIEFFLPIISLFIKVCSVHFGDGKPTEQHPYPELLLGHTMPIVKGRSSSRMTKRTDQDLATNSDAGGVEGVAQFIDVSSSKAR